MSAPESQVLAAIAELEAEENSDDITELVRWQLEQGVERGEHEAELDAPYSEEELEAGEAAIRALAEALPSFDVFRNLAQSFGEAAAAIGRIRESADGSG